MDLNQLTYGNLNQEDLDFLKSPINIVDLKPFYKKYLNFPFPDLNITKAEITDLITLRRNNSKSVFDFSLEADADLDALFFDEFTDMNMNVPLEYINAVLKDISPLIIALKIHYNRPRPYQIAYYTKQRLFPNETISGNSPAYPSGHAAQAWFLCLAVALKYPDKKNQLVKLAEKVAYTRLYLGVHYPSDNNLGKKIATEIISNAAIKRQLAF